MRAMMSSLDLALLRLVMSPLWTGTADYQILGYAHKMTGERRELAKNNGHCHQARARDAQAHARFYDFRISRAPWVGGLLRPRGGKSR